ncbi:MAG: hypothetical protein Q9173_004508 [Seirophora scorigena]
MPSDGVERRPEAVKERASIHRLLNDEDTEKTGLAEDENAARILMAMAAQDRENTTDDEDEDDDDLVVDEDAARRDLFDPTTVTDFTNGASSTGPPRPFNETRDVPNLSKQGHYVGDLPLRCLNPEVPVFGDRKFKPLPMSGVYRRKVPLKRFSWLERGSDNPDLGASESDVTVAAAPAVPTAIPSTAVNHPVVQQAGPVAVPTVTPFTAVNRPTNHQAGQQRSAAARKPAVKKLEIKKPARKPARKPATKKVSVPVAAPPQEESQVVEKTSSGRAVKRRRIYEG